MGSSADTRPDPDELLQRLQQQEEQRSRGKLRLYFGASAGVGKTYAMLSAAGRERQNGRDVVVGVIETHGRSETAELLDGLEVLAPRQIAYRGKSLPEFDIDAALARKPQVLLVDELAHSNVEGSRHPKRWQDVQELLEAGIDVWTALNVQHLESLNGTVGAITGIRVHETVPDTVLDSADEIILVDVTPDELIARLKAGKVYLPQQAERAAQNFFRKGNLIALREIALRRTAEHVEDDVRSWRVEQSGALGAADGLPPVWNTAGSLLACVGPHEGAEQTVRTAARLAGQLNVRWHAVYVETPRLQRLDAPSRDHVLAVLKLAGELGAANSVVTGSDIATELVTLAQKLNCATLVVGRPRRPAFWRRTLTRQIAQQAPALDIVEVGRADSARRLTRNSQLATEEASQSALSEQWPAYAWAVAASVVITALATPLIGWFDLANIVMLFLLGVVLIAIRFGRGPAALAALFNVAAFDFFFVPPRFSFAVTDVQYLVTFAVMLVVGLLTGQLTSGLRFQARIASGRERRAQSLFELTRDLSAALLAEQVAELGQAAVTRTFGGQALVLVTDAHDQIMQPNGAPADFDFSIADWAYRNVQPAGLATSTLSANAWHYVPLKAPMRVRGVLALKPQHARWLLIPEQLQQLDTLARQIAIALERVHYVDIAQQAVVQMESERLRNAMLAAISHDVRTPLTALIGLADSLRRSPLNEEQDKSVLAISNEARQLSALVNNLLDMARLQSGSIKLRSEWQSVEEVVGSAIRQARHALGDMPVKTELPSDLPLVEFDAVLVERVLVNLLENAAKYGGPPIEIGAAATPDSLVMTVRDHGPGLPVALKGREHELFDKFTRGEAESAKPGVGLGLAICKAVVDAHRGQIRAANGAHGGAEFTITLPRRAPPAELAET
jgi:two-component system sensor histidine kinase KdpD